MAIASGSRTVVGVFHSVHDANEAVRELESLGVARSDVSIVANKNAVGYESMDRTGTKDKAADVVADAGIGAAIGGVGGLLLSAAGAITIPVIGPILAAGPIVAALTGAGIGAATGGLVGALTESGVPEEHARHYAEGVRRGDVLVTVHAPMGREDEVCDVLDRNNAVDVDDRVQNWKDRGWTGYRDDAKPFTADEYRTERGYYTGSTLTGETGIGVDRERSRLSRDADTAGTGDLSNPGGTYSGGASGQPPMGAWNTGVRDTGVSGTGADAGERNVKTWSDDTRGDFGRRTGDAADEMKRDAKEAWRDTKDVMHGRTGKQPHDVAEDVREGTQRRSDFGDRTSDAMGEMKRDAKEAWRDTKDVMRGRTGTQPHDVAEDAREAERRRRSRIYDRNII